MSQRAEASSAAEASQLPVVVWWPSMRTHADRLPRGGMIGWSTLDGSRHGELWVTNPLRRLTGDVVEHQLGVALRSMFGDVQLIPLDSSDVHAAEIELLATGHNVHDADLAVSYGLEVVAGVVVSPRDGDGGATVVFERTLGRVVRDAAARVAGSKLDGLPDQCTANDLEARGWSPTTAGRWQLLICQ